MNIVVSGSRGFIGSAVKKELESRGHHALDGNDVMAAGEWGGGGD
jgi:nucleoside-diphosphate-sugar epimerase